MYIGKIQADSSDSSGAKIVDIQGTRSTSNTFEVDDTPEPPNVRTTATDTLTDSHSAYPGSEVTIKDEVVYENLIVGSTYTLKGELLDRNTGLVIKDANGNPVTAEKKFVPESVNRLSVSRKSARPLLVLRQKSTLYLPMKTPRSTILLLTRIL